MQEYSKQAAANQARGVLSSQAGHPRPKPVGFTIPAGKLGADAKTDVPDDAKTLLTFDSLFMDTSNGA